MQVVGANCAVCGTKIFVAPEGGACASCDVALHNKCADGHVCAGPAKAAAAAARAAPADTRPAAQRHQWVIIAASVTVASIVVPWFRHWQTERGIAERAANHLGCAASDVDVVNGPGSLITAKGCGNSISYLRVCPQTDRAECLEAVATPRP